MADSSGLLAGVGAGLFGGLGDALSGLIRQHQDNLAAEAEHKQAWDDFVARNRFQSDLNEQAADKAEKRHIATAETIYSYEQNAKQLADQGMNDPEMARIVAKVSKNDPNDPPTEQEKQQYDAFKEAAGYASNGQPIPVTTLWRIRSLPIGVKSTFMAQHQAAMDLAAQRKRQAAEMEAKTELTGAEVENHLDAPWMAAMREDTAAGKQRAKDNAVAVAYTNSVDKIIRDNNEKIAAAHVQSAKAKTQEEKNALYGKMQTYQDAIDKANNEKNSFLNAKKTAAEVQFRVSGNPHSEELAGIAAESREQPVPSQLEQAQQRAAQLSSDSNKIVPPSPWDTYRAPWEGAAPQMTSSTQVGKFPAPATAKPTVLDNIPAAPADHSQLQDGHIYRFPSGLGVYHKATQAMTPVDPAAAVALIHHGLSMKR